MHTENGPVVSAPAFAILLCLSLSIRLFFSLPPFCAILVPLALTAAWMLIGTQAVTRNFLRIFFTILALCALFSGMCMLRLLKTPDIPSTIETNGKILLVREWGKRSALLIGTEYGKVVAYVEKSLGAEEGASVHLRAATFDFKRASEKGGFDEYLFWRAKGAQKRALPQEIKRIAPPHGLGRWRAILERRIRETLPERTASYVLALTVGIRGDVLSDLHKRAGTLHLLAVSGLHVGIVAAFVSFFLKRGLGRIAGISAAMWGYVLVAGMPVGGVRAALMIQICLLAGLFGRPSSAFNGVSAAAAMMLLYNPWSYFDVGWRLSVLAALFLAALFSLLEKRRSLALLASPLVWFVTAGEVSNAFGEVPLSGLFLNIVAVPVFSFLFPAILFLSLPSLLGLPLADMCAFAAEYILEIWDTLFEMIPGLVPFALTHTAFLSFVSCLLFAAAVTRASGYTKRRSALALLLLPFLLFFIP